MPTVNPATEPVERQKSPKIYEVGTLRYSPRKLMVLFVWLIWGDFAFCFFESIFGNFIPLYLKDYNAPNALIGVMMGSIAGAVNILFLPSISRWSDEFRGRWGRRIPFLAITTPLTVISMIFLGFAPEIAGVVHDRLIRPMAPAVSFTVVVLWTISIFTVVFHFLNMVLVNAFNWLLRDVVPQEWMGRFLSWFRMISTVSGVLFNWYIFPHIISSRKEICVGIGLFYLVTFLLMCWKVKEGEYPPPQPREQKPNVIGDYLRYFKTCLSVPIYRLFFFSVIMGGMAACSGPFMLFFQRDTVGVSMEQLGKLFAMQGVLTAVLYIPMGWVCDKFSPLRVSLLLQPAMFLLTLFNFFFVKGEQSLYVAILIGTILGVPVGLAGAAITMELFPSSKFGQFFAAQNLFSMGVRIGGNYVFGLLLDITHSNYRMVFLWNALFALPIFYFTWLVYQRWKSHGGPDNYMPPMPVE